MTWPTIFADLIVDFVRAKAIDVHAVEDAPLHGLEAVAGVGNGAVHYRRRHVLGVGAGENDFEGLLPDILVG